jgi:hypothetical protein
MAPHKTYTIQSAHYIHTSGLSSPYCHITPSVSDGHTGSCAYFVRSLLLLGLFSTIDSFTDYTHVSLQEDLIIDQIISIAFKWKASYSALQLSFQFFGIGSHHQTGIAELHIRDLSDSARASLFPSIHYWPKAVCKKWNCLLLSSMPEIWETRISHQVMEKPLRSFVWLDIICYIWCFTIPPFWVSTFCTGLMANEVTWKFHAGSLGSQVRVYLSNCNVALLLDPLQVMSPLNIMW